MDSTTVAEMEKFLKEPDPWRVGNDVLYDMCSKYPYHKDESEIIAKVWLIGRSYAASIERNKKKKEEISDDFYTNVVAPLFKAKLDELLLKVRELSDINEENIGRILQTHKSVVELVKEITDDEKRSFVSKYLHFHFPNLFFIYDSRVAGVITSVSGRLEEKNIPSLPEWEYDDSYKIFFLMCWRLRKYAEERGVKLTPRQLDSFLIRKANEKQK